MQAGRQNTNARPAQSRKRWLKLLFFNNNSQYGNFYLSLAKSAF